MNKGFAETGRVFAEGPICFVVPILIGVSVILSLRLIGQIQACWDV